MSRLLAILLMVLTVAATPAWAAKALFDNSHAEQAGQADWIIDDTQPIPSPAQSGITWATPETYWTGGISAYGIALVKRGYTVHTNTAAFTYGNSSNTYDLSNYDLLVIIEPNTVFTAAETTAIKQFVANGGGLVAVCDHNGSDRNNDGYDSPAIYNLLDPTHAFMGVHWGVSGDANNSITQVSTNIAPSASDSITHGPAGTCVGLSFSAGNTCTIYTSANPTVRGEVWMNGVSQTSTSSIMAASARYGNGRIFTMGDSSPVDDGTGTSGNTLYNGWSGEASGGDSTLMINAALWATRSNSSPSDNTPPTVTVTSPNGGEDWYAGSTHAITWTATDNVGVTTIDLAYSADGGSTFPYTIATGVSNTGTYNWTVGNVPGTQTRVAVTAHDAAGNSAVDASNANFTIDRYTIVSSAGAGGSISPLGTTYLTYNTSRAYTITPNANNHVADVLVDGSSVGAVTSYTFTNVTANHTIAATFAIDTRTITASAGVNGSIAPNGAVVVNYGGSQAFTITPNANDHVADVLVDDGSVGAVTGYTFTGVTANHTIAASFAVNAHTITASAGSGGSITPSGAVNVNDGDSQSFTIAPDASHHVADVLVDGVSVGAVTGYGFTSVTSDHTIAASFAVNTFGLTVTVVGGGTVAKDPDLASYPQGSSVQLTASAGTGWAFTGWSGDTASTVNPLTLTILGAVSVTATFADVAPPNVTVLAPNGGETWVQGDTQDITWSATDNAVVDSIDVDYSLTGSDGPWMPIAYGLANSGSYSWTVPVASSEQAMVRVTARDHVGNAASDTSDAVFTINDGTTGVAGGPARLALAPPSPNPGSGPTLLSFSLPREGHARLEVMDASGRRIAALDGVFASGPHVWRWDGRLADGSPARAGLYFVRLVTPFGTLHQRLARLD